MLDFCTWPGNLVPSRCLTPQPSQIKDRFGGLLQACSIAFALALVPRPLMALEDDRMEAVPEGAGLHTGAGAVRGPVTGVSKPGVRRQGLQARISPPASARSGSDSCCRNRWSATAPARHLASALSSPRAGPPGRLSQSDSPREGGDVAPTSCCAGTSPVNVALRPRDVLCGGGKVAAGAERPSDLPGPMLAPWWRTSGPATAVLPPPQGKAAVLFPVT